MPSVAGVTAGQEDGWERRARVLPWGIEIQVWRLVETRILPDSAGNLPLATLLFGSEDGTGAVAGAAPDDDPTLENLELEYVDPKADGHGT